MMGSLLETLKLNQLRDPTAVLDLLLLWFAIYQVMLLVRRTRAVQMVWGLLSVVVFWWITSPQGLLPLTAVHWVLGRLLLIGPFAIIVIFQQSIRQALAHFGRYGRYAFWRLNPQETSSTVIEEVALACSAMGSRRIGALIVFEKVNGLRNYVETGIGLDALVSYDLLMNLFSPKTPLHDGAVIIGEDRIKGASCFLPLTTNPYLSRKYGTRHRAAIGITEETDAVAVSVSEERGMISVAVGGKLTEDLDTRSLREFLEQHLLQERSLKPSLKSMFGRQPQVEAETGS